MTTQTLVAQIAPQRSTQYAQLATTLAPYELVLSGLAPAADALAAIRLGGQAYLKWTLAGDLDANTRYELGTLSMTSAFFRYYDSLGAHPGPLLAPIDLAYEPVVTPDLAFTRRYRGKTNELFTHFLCNLARYSSDFAGRRWDGLRLLDPLAGGGTTLFTALSLGADVVGVEQTEQDVASTITFLRDYMRQAGIGCKVKEERLQKLGQRWWCTISADGPRQFVFARGQTAQADQLIRGFKKPHFIVGDLPYGVQHKGTVTDLLRAALPGWAGLLASGGALVLAWDATAFPREEMIALVEGVSSLQVLNDPPYDRLAHRVDRVIKRRDVIVAR